MTKRKAENTMTIWSRGKTKNGARVRQTIDLSEGGRTRQEFKDECSITNIIKKFNSTGHVSHLANMPGQYRDCSFAEDLASAFLKTEQAMADFETLPGAVKELANNDPAILAHMMTSEEGYAALCRAEQGELVPGYRGEVKTAPVEPEIPQNGNPISEEEGQTEK